MNHSRDSLPTEMKVKIEKIAKEDAEAVMEFLKGTFFKVSKKRKTTLKRRRTNSDKTSSQITLSPSSRTSP